MIEDEALLKEVAGLVEWPVVLMGEFDKNSSVVKMVTGTARTRSSSTTSADSGGRRPPTWPCTNARPGNESNDIVSKPE